MRRGRSGVPRRRNDRTRARAGRWLAVVAGLAAATALATGPAAAQRAPAEGVPRLLRAAAEAAAELPRLHSLIVNWRGNIIFERYYNGAGAARPANIKSASKSVISALVGVAIDRGLINGVGQPIATFFPDLLGAEADPRKRAITVEDLLTMRSGLESTSNRNYGAWVLSRNWVRHALSRPLAGEPGVSMIYSTGNTHLLSAVLTRATGTDTWQFAQDVLAGPLGTSLPKWARDPQGIYFGGNDMLLTPRQMMAFGRLYLSGGQAGGRQIVPAAWVAASVVPRTRSRVSRRQYGYGWWMRDLAGHRSFYAWGYGGQYIYAVPALDLVVVTTSSTSADETRRGHRRTVDEIVEELIVDPIARQAGVLPAAGSDPIDTEDPR